MRSAAALFLALLALPVQVATVAAEPAPWPIVVGRVEQPRDIEVRDGRVIVRAATGDYQVVFLPDGNPGLAPVPSPKLGLVPGDIIPHGKIVPGAGDVRQTWLAGPTDRYAHGVLGDAIEAAALKVEAVSGQILTFELPEDSVFEDIAPRLADLDGDGRDDEVIVVRSYADAGAAVAVFGIRDGRLARIAESPAIGRPNRWLNPVGAADFDGDGRAEIAAVRTPHIGGILMIYRIVGDRLIEAGRQPGFSTHAIGSTVLGMAAVLDVDGNGIADIVLPDQTRRVLHAVSFVKGRFQLLWMVDNPAPIVTSILAHDIDGNAVPDLAYGLTDGSIVLLPR